MKRSFKPAGCASPCGSAILPGRSPPLGVNRAFSGSLLRAAHAIAKLGGRADYPFYRLNDRRMLRALQGRIRDWLRLASGAPQDEDLESDGIRLWQDVLSFSSILQLINHRTELWEHDRVCILEAADALDDPGISAFRFEEAMAPLRFARGRDEELDTLLASRVAPPLHAWRSALARCRAGFRR
jgi:hypothetical protein